VSVLNQTSLLDNTVAAFKPRAVPNKKPRTQVTKAARHWLRQNSTFARNALFATIGFGSPVVAAFEWQSWAGWCALGAAALLWDKAVNANERPR